MIHSLVSLRGNSDNILGTGKKHIILIINIFSMYFYHLPESVLKTWDFRERRRRKIMGRSPSIRFHPFFIPYTSLSSLSWELRNFLWLLGLTLFSNCCVHKNLLRSFTEISQPGPSPRDSVLLPTSRWFRCWWFWAILREPQVETDLARKAHICFFLHFVTWLHLSLIFALFF